MSSSWPPSCTEEWVNTIYHPSHCMKAWVNNVGWIGQPPTCTQGVQSSLRALLDLFWTHTQCTGTQIQPCASQGVHPSMEKASRCLCTQTVCMIKKSNVHQNIRTKRWTCICTHSGLMYADKAHIRNRQASAHMQHVLFFCCVDLQCLADQRSRSQTKSSFTTWHLQGLMPFNAGSLLQKQNAVEDLWIKWVRTEIQDIVPTQFENVILCRQKARLLFKQLGTTNKYEMIFTLWVSWSKS